ncbi:MAG TPA: hypothetical protein VMX57_09830, partial [Planctomycetota bacterium]|nr:hypothetical protein [Planctomycetota bacterium]
MSLSQAFRATLACFVLVLGVDATADDGRIEINQAAALAGGVVTGDAPGFPVQITLPGSYVLTGDLTVSDPGTSAILVSASRVSLDLNGFSVTGGAVCSGAGAGIECTGASIWDGI